MTRSLFAVFVLGAVAVAVPLIEACNNPVCGAGTKQRQRADGTLACELAEQPDVLALCDVDAGTAVIVGGKCVSVVECDPKTTMVGVLPNGNQVCVGTGGGPGTCSC